MHKHVKNSTSLFPVQVTIICRQCVTCNTTGKPPHQELEVNDLPVVLHIALQLHSTPIYLYKVHSNNDIMYNNTTHLWYEVADVFRYCVLGTRHIPYIANRLRWKSFVDGQGITNSLENFHTHTHTRTHTHTNTHTHAHTHMLSQTNDTVVCQSVWIKDGMVTVFTVASKPVPRQ